MPLSQFRNVVGSAATAAVLCYSYLGSPPINTTDFDRFNIQIKIPEEMNFDYYQLTGNEQAVVSQQIDIIQRFASNILDNIKELDPEFSKTVDENFWNLI